MDSRKATVSWLGKFLAPLNAMCSTKGRIRTARPAVDSPDIDREAHFGPLWRPPVVADVISEAVLVKPLP